MANLKNTDFNDSGFLQLPTGSGNERPNTPLKGMVRFNTSRNEIEVYTGSYWKIIENQSKSLSLQNLLLHFDSRHPGSYSGDGNTIKDLSGNDNNGSLIGGSFESSYQNSTKNTFEFSDNGFIEAAISGFENEHTILVWKRSNVDIGTSSSRRGGFRMENTWNPGLWWESDIIRPHVNGQYRDTPLRPNIPGTDWHLWGQVYDGNNVYAIVDGIVLNYGDATNYSPGSNNGRFIFGNIDSDITGEFLWNGSIAKAQIYNRALSIEEISKIYATDAVSFGKSTIGTVINPANSAEDIQKSNPFAQSGVYWYAPLGCEPFAAFTDFKNDGGAWVLIAKYTVGSGKTFENMFNADSRNIEELQNFEQLTSTNADANSRLSRYQMNCLWMVSTKNVLRLHFDRSGGNPSGIYYQKKITDPKSIDFWNALQNPVLWSDGSTAGSTPDIDYGGVRWSATYAVDTNNPGWQNMPESNDFYEVDRNILVFRGSPNRPASNGDYEMGGWDYPVTVRAPGRGDITVARHGGLLGDITSGNQWPWTSNPSDSRWPNEDDRRSLIFLRC